MSRTFSTFTKAEIQHLLCSGKRVPDSWHYCGGELVAVWRVSKSSLVVKVYTTVRKDDVCAPCGEDAIRVCVVDEPRHKSGDGRGVRSYSPTIRVDGWERRLIKKIHGAYVDARSILDEREAVRLSMAC